GDEHAALQAHGLADVADDGQALEDVHQYLTRGSMRAEMTSTMKFVTATITASTTTMPCTATKSRLSRYSTSWKPRPFHSKVVSVSTAPASIIAICMPMTVMTGMSAGRHACRVTSRNSLTPRDLPDSIYCWPSVPMRL